MRLLLIDPVTTAGSLPVETRRRLRQGIGYPGIGLLTVAALTPPDVEIRFVDESVEDVDNGFLPDLVGISVQAPTAPHAYRIASRFREAGVPVVLGGIHTSLNPEEAAEHADAVVIGEAELTWPALWEDFRKGRLRREYRAEGLARLDASPRPRRDLLRVGDYRLPWVIQASKGCPFGCGFCSLHAYVGYEPRFRSVDRVAEEIRSLPGEIVLFADDNIYASREFAKDLFRALAPLGKRWVAEATWHIAFDDEVLELARESGCVGLFIGLDAVEPQELIRKTPRRGEIEDTYVEALRNIQRKGMATVAAFVFGLDNDDPSVFPRAFEIVRKGGANLVNFSVLVPYPGTPIFEQLRDEGRITEWDWSKYISPTVCFEPKRMSATELVEGTRWTQKKFFSLRHVVKTAARTCARLGWGMGLLTLKLNLAQRRNWGRGSGTGDRDE